MPNLPKTRSIDDVYRNIEDYDLVHDEFVYPRKLIDRFECLGLGQTYLSRNKHTYSFTEWALSQLCAKVGISKKSYDKCAQRMPDLAEKIVSKRLNVMKDRLLLRYDKTKKKGKKKRTKGQVRAVLSENYSKYHNREFFDLIQSSNPKGIRIIDNYVDEEVFEIKVLLDDFAACGEKWWTGFRCLNSEVGASRIRVEFMVYRLVCSNGLIVREKQYDEPAVSQIHYGINKTKLEEEVREAFDLGPGLTGEIEQKIERECDRKLDRGMVGWLEEKISHVLTRSEMLAVGEKMHQDRYPRNYLGYANAISELVHGYRDGKENGVQVSYGKRRKLEEFAGMVMLLSL